ncbi:MAG: AI-2E family transporter [Anaerolineae bacterium]
MTANTTFPSIFRALVSLASLIIVLAAMRFFAPILAPILLAFFFSILLFPLLSWLRRKGLPTSLAFGVMVLGVMLLGLGLVVLLGISFKQLEHRLPDYEVLLSDEKAAVEAWLGGQGVDISAIRPLDLIDIKAAVAAIGRFLRGLQALLSGALFMLATIVFALLEGSSLPARLREGLGLDNPLSARVALFGQKMIRYFVVRTAINLLTGAAIALFLLILGVDFALLWGTLAFLLGYVPYIGQVLALTPAVILALVESGVGLALLVIVGLVVLNALAENALAPLLLQQELSLSPLTVLLSFIFWVWLLGPLGTVLAMPLTVALVFVLDSYEDTRWLAILMAAPGTVLSRDAPAAEGAQQDS